MNWSVLYGAFSLGVFTITRFFFYSRYKVTGMNKVPWKERTLFTPNHQNAFLDAIMLASESRRQTGFMVRADVFKPKLANAVLRSMHLRPIYRPRDGASFMEKNEAVFADCRSMLARRRPIILFPEGNHSNRKRLRPLKKGAGRIALGALAETQFQEPVYLVPVGLNYQYYERMGGSFYIRIGNPIDLRELADVFKENEARGLNVLKQRLEEEMHKNMIHIEHDFMYEATELACVLHREEAFEQLGLKRKRDLEDEFYASKHISSELNAWGTNHPEAAKTFGEQGSALKQAIEALKLRPWLFGKTQYSAGTLFMRLLLAGLLLPVSLTGLVINYLPWMIPDWFVKAKVKDSHFEGSIRVALALFTFPILYLPWAFAMVAVLGAWKWFFLSYLIFPTLGYIALHLWRFNKKTLGMLRYNRLRKNGDSSMQQAVELHAAMKATLTTVVR